MRKRKPPVASLDEVTIRRQGSDAIIDFRDPTIATTHFRIGPEVRRMTDRQIRSGLKASGAAPEEVECFTQAVRQRIMQMHSLVRSN